MKEKRRQKKSKLLWGDKEKKSGRGGVFVNPSLSLWVKEFARCKKKQGGKKSYQREKLGGEEN